MNRNAFRGPLNKSLLCDFDTVEADFLCKNCGIKIPRRLFQNGQPLVACTKPAKQAPQEPPQVGLGDMVASALDGIGVTKDRVQALANKIGIRDCGCKARQAAMNSFGQKYFGIGAKPKGEQVKNPIDSP